jgi:predicted CxxxxCH...CXXCH cytochrome family protein
VRALLSTTLAVTWVAILSVGCESDTPGSGGGAPDAQAEEVGPSDTGDGRPDLGLDGAVDAGGDAGTPDSGGDGGASDASDPDAGGPFTCWSCHGEEGQPAPPVDTMGRSDTATRTVGAHRSHLRPNPFGRETACTDCHVVPAAIEDEGHIDAPPAELEWGPIARAGGVTAGMNGDTCSVYCHGASLSGGSNPEPDWTRVGGGEAYCGSCHGIPPPDPHPPVEDFNCGPCHPYQGVTPQDKDRHIDGILDVSLGCTSCHGSPQSIAPPVDTQGRSDPTNRTVGAHQSHLGPNAIGREVRCTDCHVLPAAIDEPGHIDPAPAELTWGPVARADGVAPSMDGDTCSVYCHGASLEDGTNPEPDWTRVGQGEAACGTCHGLPPTALHPPSASTNCGPCHPFTGFAPDDQSRHIDGVLDVAIGCTSCHGGPSGSAPPVDTGGNSATTFVGVGAHQSHLVVGSTWHADFPCSECHVVPAAVGSLGHIDGDGIAEVDFGGIATTDGAAGTWDGTTCGVYCHGDTLTGGSNATPEWTRVGSGEAACGTCHGLPPPAPHPPNARCADCHGAVVDANLDFVDPELHINGLVDEDTECGDCHGLPPATGAHAAHADLAAATYGGLGTAADLSSPAGYAYGCGHCHPRDSSLHRSGGRADIVLYDATAPAPSIKALHPATASYTPGPIEFLDAFNVPYTEGTCSNVYCHSGIETTSGAVAVPGDDFPFTGYPISYTPAVVTTRTRAFVDADWGGGATTCDDCHSFPARSEDPATRAAAGESHAFIGADGRETLHMFNHGFDPVDCVICHAETAFDSPTYVRDTLGVTTLDPIPIDGFDHHADGVVDVVIDGTATFPYGTPADLSTARWDPIGRTCSNVECHLNQSQVEFGTPHRPSVTVECNRCHRM